MDDFAEFGLCVPEVLLPVDADVGTWSVVACDQYTQDAAYWESADRAVGDRPSTLRMILPELYLEKPGCDDRIARVRDTMAGYLSGGIFGAPQKEFVYVERRTAYGRTRRGLVCAVDLDAYDWRPGNAAPIRATEQTIESRIPPRKKIRNGAPLELPHIMLLANDPQHLLVERAGDAARKDAPLYDGDLMLSAGHVTGWAVRSPQALAQVHQSLCALKEHGSGEHGTFLFAVGDGNHSLATAKAVWDEWRATLRANGTPEPEIARSPVRYALVEVVNIYDPGLTFEPIHRVLFGAQPDALLGFLESRLGGTVRTAGAPGEVERAVQGGTSCFGVAWRADGACRYAVLETGIQELAVSALQPALDDFARAQGDSVSMDYIHGTDEVFRLGGQDNAVALLLPPVDKDSFFATIAKTGCLPRKSFSMGEASEKRFYLECRRLFG